MTKYRIKTEEEFKKDGQWMLTYPTTWSSRMTHLVGQDVPDENIEPIEAGYCFYMGEWCVSSKHVVLNQISTQKDITEKPLRTYKYVLENRNSWAITDSILIIVAKSKTQAKNKLNKSGYDVKKTSEIVELKEGIHLVQEAITE